MEGSKSEADTGAWRSFPVSLGDDTITISSMSFTRVLSSSVSSVGRAYACRPEQAAVAKMRCNLFMSTFVFGGQNYAKSPGGAILKY